MVCLSSKFPSKSAALLLSCSKWEAASFHQHQSMGLPHLSRNQKLPKKSTQHHAAPLYSTVPVPSSSRKHAGGPETRFPGGPGVFIAFPPSHPPLVPLPPCQGAESPPTPHSPTVPSGCSGAGARGARRAARRVERWSSCWKLVRPWWVMAFRA